MNKILALALFVVTSSSALAGECTVELVVTTSPEFTSSATYSSSAEANTSSMEACLAYGNEIAQRETTRFQGNPGGSVEEIRIKLRND